MQRTKNMPDSKVLQDKDYYTTYDLVRMKWFPVKSTITLTKLIESGKLNAVNVSPGKYKRYRIPKQSALDFVKAQQNVTPAVANKRAKKTKK